MLDTSSWPYSMLRDLPTLADEGPVAQEGKSHAYGHIAIPKQSWNPHFSREALSSARGRGPHRSAMLGRGCSQRRDEENGTSLLHFFLCYFLPARLLLVSPSARAF